jgi:D-alanyl-D-alanine carboxypeptidase (penicillin-binding protein 5/6)
MKIAASLAGLSLALASLLLPATSMAKPPHKARPPAPVPEKAMPPGATLASASSESPSVPNPPDVYAHAFIVIDYTTGQVLAQHDADVRMEPASLTKLMTCYGIFRAL